MKKLIQLFHTHITLAKLTCIALLFTPLWGWWWFNIDPEMWAGVGHHFVLYVWIQYLFKSIPVAIVYTSVCLLAVISFVVATFIRPRVVRVPLMLVLLIGWAFELSILDLNGAVSNQDLLWIFWQEWETAPEAVGGYAPYIIRNCAFVGTLSIALCAAPSRRFSVSGIFGLLPVLSGALVAGVIVYTKGGTQIFPIPFGTFSNAAMVLANAWNSPRSAGKPESWDPALLRDVVTKGSSNIEATVHPIFNKIVVIMDESVRGDYLSLNDAAENTTPFLKAADNLINFGVAISSGNCSHISRTIFRFGMRQSDLPNGWREGLYRPTVWQFARSAGYKTLHIDAFGGLSIHQLSPVEKTLIDSNITIFENPGYLRDQKLVGRLLRALNDEGPAFIYVEKYGVHPPYSTKYPPDFHAFPTPVESAASKHQNPIIASVDAFLRSFLPLREYSDRAIANYPNAIAWSVDEFFRKLLPAVDLSKTLIIYTSDHGQSLLPGHFTHCSTTAARASLGEAYVPLVAITSMPEFRQRLEKGAARGFGRFSHFEVFPTLLLAMGYDVGWVKGSYGPSLMDSPPSDRKFMIGSPAFQPMMIPVNRNFMPTPSSKEPRQAEMPMPPH